MTHKHNGGPAFPLSIPGLECRARFESGYGGISVRDYFAAKAMQGLLSGLYRDTSKYNFGELPTESYAIADAMLAAREIK